MRKLTIILTVISALAACSSIDCPLNNRVYATYRLIGDTVYDNTMLTVTTPLSQAENDDSVLINRMEYSDSISLPMSYSRTEDIFFFCFEDSNGISTNDTIKVSKVDTPHFESVDCNPTFFHTITGVTYTKYAIDSIIINKNTVTYNAAEAHFIIYLKGGDSSEPSDGQ